MAGCWRLASGPVENRLKAMQITQELGLGELLRTAVTQLCNDPKQRAEWDRLQAEVRDGLGDGADRNKRAAAIRSHI